MCAAAGHQGPLYKCDFDGNKEAGQLMADTLQMGASYPWPMAMFKMTGQSELDSSAFVEYFQPLLDFLTTENNNNNECYGWNADWPEEIMKTLPTPRCSDILVTATTPAPVTEITESPTSVTETTLSADDDYETFLKNFAEVGTPLFGNREATSFYYETNKNEETEAKVTEAKKEYSSFRNEQAELAEKFDLLDIPDFHARRQLEMIRKVGIKLNVNDTEELSDLQNAMVTIYESSIHSWNSTTGKPDPSVQWQLEPELTERMAMSRDYDELKYIWKEFRRVTAPMKSKYKQFVSLSNKGAKADGFKDTGEYWRSEYEVSDLEAQTQTVLLQLLNFYEHLHAYVRRKLVEQYPKRFKSSAIPAHLLGNMWSQTWSNIFDITDPYPNIDSIDVTTAMRKQNYTAESMYRLSNSFFKDLGLKGMPEQFFNDSMLEKPDLDELKVICHATAYDFFVNNEVRVKQCTVVTQEDLLTAHHEMGHCEYFLQYGHQPPVFRTSANAGFHEAVGDTLALAVSTPAHLKNISLLEQDFIETDEQDIKYLFKQALDKIAFLPFGYLIDAYRWRVFSGEFKPDEWNDKWWELRQRFQGIVPPVDRPKEAFDAGAKYHVPANVPYIRYFVSFVSQFQFYKAMCEAAGHKGPLYKCDFGGSLEAGQLLADMLKMGASEPWPVAMYRITGQSELRADAFVEYFDKLLKFLEKTNKDNNECYGWNADWPEQVMKSLPTPRCGDLLTVTTSAPVTETTPSAGGTAGRGQNLLLAMTLATYFLAK